MLKFRKAASAAMAVVILLLALFTAGCSTPKVAMTVDGKEYTTGEYLAYLYNAFQQVYFGQYLYYYAQSGGYDVWGEKYPYGEGDKAEELSLSDYISRLAQDTIKRQVAIMNRMEEQGITLTEEKQKELDEELAKLKKDQYLAFGFNNDSYAKMFREYYYNETALFYGLYDVGGKSPDAMTEEEIRTYFDKNFLSYKIIEKSLTDSSGKEMSEDEQKEIRNKLDDYLKLYEETKDFDKVIEKQKADDAADNKSDSTTPTTGATGNGTTATTAADESKETGGTTSAATNSTTGGETTPTSAENSDKDSDESGDEDDKTPTDPNRKDIDANTYGDEEFTNAIKSLAFNEAKVVTYKKGGEKLTAALILRLDPEADRGEDVDFFKDSREQVIHGARFEEYDKEIKEYIETLTVEINNSAVKACDPKKFLDV